MSIGRNEVRITKVYTVEAGEFSDKHDPTPNWRENGTPNHGAGSRNLRIEAEAGTTLGVSGMPYHVIIQAVCLTNPLAVLGGNLTPPPMVETFGANWEYQASEDKYTKSWSIPIPTGPLFTTPPAPAFFKQVSETWQFIVSLEDPATPKHVACTLAGEPFLLT